MARFRVVTANIVKDKDGERAVEVRGLGKRPDTLAIFPVEELQEVIVSLVKLQGILTKKGM